MVSRDDKHVMQQSSQGIDNLIPSDLLVDENDNEILNYVDEPECDSDNGNDGDFECDSELKKVYTIYITIRFSANSKKNTQKI